MNNQYNTTKQDFVTAVIPAHNEEDNIRTTLNIATSSNIIDEVIVVSDGSTDQTVEIANSYSNVKVIHLEENQGKGRAMDIGIENSYGDIILFLDADLKGLDHNRMSFY